MDSVWWKKINNSTRFIHDITSSLLENQCSVILNADVCIPFYCDFIEAVKEKLLKKDARRAFKEIDMNDYNSLNAEDFLFENFCTEEKKGDFFPKKSYTKANFLSEHGIYKLNMCFVWVRNIKEENMQSWLDFLMDYSKGSSYSSAIFILELSGKINIPDNPDCYVRLSADDYFNEFDKYVYCFLLAAEIKNITSEIKQYIAELASVFCSDKIELCKELFECGLDFAVNPQETVKRIFDSETFNENEADAVVWRIQNKMLFPLFEQFRRKIVDEHYYEIDKCLPLTLPYCQPIDKPYHLDLGNIKLLCDDNTDFYLKHDDYELLCKYRDIRNDLAHMKPVTFEELQQCLGNN